MAEVFYQRISEAEVDPGLVRSASRALVRARAALGLPEIRIQWVKPISKESFEVLDGCASVRSMLKELSSLAAGRPGFVFKDSDVFLDSGGFFGKVHPFKMKLAGGTRENMIWISVAVPLGRVAAVVGHECKHLADFRDKKISVQSIWTKAGREAAERAADRFGEELTRLLEE